MAENHVLLETIELTQSAASVTFDNIPQTGYTDLKIVCSAMSNRSSQGDYILLAFNGNTTSYSARIIEGNGTGISNDTTARCAGIMNSNTSTANVFGNNEIYIPNYTSSNYKSYSAEGVSENNATVAYQDLVAGLWSNTAAITSIVLSPNAGTSFFANSTFSLYGVAATGTTPATAPKATGGNIVANDGTYWYHAFLSSGTFTPQTALTADVLTIAGGGGGGGGAFDRGYGGGGGAGGIVYNSAQSLTTTSYLATIGAGGSGGLGLGNPGINGSNTTFTGGVLSLTASVGGGGGGAFSVPGTAYSGGSGGGGGNNGGTAGAGTAGQGFAGGSGQSYTTGGYGNGLPGGGGGAGEAGNTDGQGAGGDGVATYSSWASATNTGVSGYFAGGGAAGPGAAGGLGGGANGVGNISSNGNNGTVNTGGGGSNAGGQNPASTGGSGGAGIVIIRYAMV